MRPCVCGESRIRQSHTRTYRKWSMVISECARCGLYRDGKEYPPLDYLYRDEEGVYPAPCEKSARHQMLQAELMGRVIESRIMRRGRALEIGFGQGMFLKWLASRGWQAQGIEANAEYVRWAHAQGIEGRCGAFPQDMPQGESFDLICMVHVLEHFPDLRLALEQVARYLAPGGYLFVAVPNFLGPGGTHAQIFFPGQHYWFFDRRTLRSALARCGFEARVILSLPELFEEDLHSAQVLGRVRVLRSRIRAFLGRGYHLAGLFRKSEHKGLT
jgi:2-polyprenyl-3-methyl-5-hydroxy-6-metoxy-1,4-benzoquinol methylase